MVKAQGSKLDIKYELESLRELQDIFSLALFTYLPCFAEEAVQTGMSFRRFLPWILPTTVTEAMSIKTRFH